MIVVFLHVPLNVCLTGILRYKVDFQSMQLDDIETDGFDLDDY